MSSIIKTGWENRFSVLGQAGTPDTVKEKNSVKENSAVSEKNDFVQLSEEGKSSIERKAAAKEWIANLQNSYTGISVSFSGKILPYGLKQTAAGLGKGSHLVISHDFLERMSSSEEAFKECQDVLSNVMEQLDQASEFERASGAYLDDGKVTFWSAPEKKDDKTRFLEMMRRMQEQEKERKTKKSDRVKDPRYSASSEDYNTAGKYASLAGAGNQSAVRRVMSDAHKSIARLRLSSCFGDKEEQIKARMAVRSLQKLLLRGSKKLTRLNQEELCEARKKRAAEQKEREKEQKIALELKKRRKERASADRAIEAEGKLDSANMNWRRKSYDDLQKEAESFGIDFTAGMESVGEIFHETANVSGDTVTASEIHVSESIQF